MHEIAYILPFKPNDSLMLNRNILLLCIAVAGCASTTPQEIIPVKLTHGVESPIFVTAARQKVEISQSLRNAGFNVVDRLEDCIYLVRATIGIDQDKRECGSLNNVRYQLRSQSQTIIEVEAKGWTGSCQPNVLDHASRELRSRVIEMLGK